MDKPIRRTVGICVGHSLKTRPMEFYSPCEVEPYITYLEQRAEAAEAKLAELAKQKPVGTVSIVRDWNTHRNVATVNMRHDLVVSEMKDGDELYTRASPAVVPVDLVPPMKDDSIPGKNDSYIDMCDGWNACRAEMLRRIEELK